MEDVFIKYGLPGAVIAALALFVAKLIEWHRKDRQAWEEQTKKQRQEMMELFEKLFNRQADLTDESNRVTRDNTSILAGLKSLLENQLRR